MALIKAKTQINFEWNMWIGLQIAALQFIYIPIVIKVLNQAWLIADMYMALVYFWLWLAA